MRGPKKNLERVQRAVDLRLEGWTLQQIADDLGVSHQRVQQMLRGTVVEGVTAAEAEKRRQEKQAAIKARAEARKSEPCSTCGRTLRYTRNGYGFGECSACRQYRRKWGMARPATLHANPVVPRPRRQA